MSGMNAVRSTSILVDTPTHILTQPLPPDHINIYTTADMQLTDESATECTPPTLRHTNLELQPPPPQQQQPSQSIMTHLNSMTPATSVVPMIIDDDIDNGPAFGPAPPTTSAAAAADPASTAAATAPAALTHDSSASLNVSTTAAAISTAAAPASSSTSIAPLVRRVKLYQLGVSGQWEDHGTGFLSYVGDGSDGQPNAEELFRLVIVREEPISIESSATTGVTTTDSNPMPATEPDLLLNHLLTQGADYQMQSQTIITFCFIPTSNDVALSFQDESVCREVWDVLSQQIKLIAAKAMREHESITLSSHEPSLIGNESNWMEMVQPELEEETRLRLLQQSQLMLMNPDETDGGVLLSPHELMSGVQQELTTLTSQLTGHALVDDYPYLPPVSIDGLDALASRIQHQRICKRELEEVIAIWQAKEEEFRDNLEEERKEEEERRRQVKNGSQLLSTPRRDSTLPRTQPTSPITPNRINSSHTPSNPSTPTPPVAATSNSQFLSPSSSSSSTLQATLCAPPSPAFSPAQHTLTQLHSIFRFVKALLLTNDVEVLEILFSDSGMEHLIGMLEYDPIYSASPASSSTSASLPVHDFHTHRTFLARAQFKYVIPFYDDIVLHKIHQNYKVTYLKDVILSAHLDDPTLNTLTQIIFVNMVSIISRLTEKKEFIQALFKTLNQFTSVEFAAIQEQNVLLERQQTVLLEEALGASRTGSGVDEVNESMDSLSSDTTQPDGSAPAMAKPTSFGGSATPPLPQSGSQTDSESSISSQPNRTDSNQAVDSTSLLNTTNATDSQTQSQPPVASNSFIGPSPTPPPSTAPLVTTASLKSVLLFLQELVLMAKNVQVPVRDAFYKVLDQNSLFDVLEAILSKDEQRQRTQAAAAEEAGRETKSRMSARLTPTRPPLSNSQSSMAIDPTVSTPASTLDSSNESPHNWLWLICTDIISNICIHDASLFRTYLISVFHVPQSILNMIFRLLAQPNLSGSLAHQLSCLIRLVLDPEAMSLQDQYIFLGKIYEAHLHKLLQPLHHLQPLTPNETPFQQTFSSTTNPLLLLQQSKARLERDRLAASYHTAAYHAIELLSYCALHHSVPPPDDAHPLLQEQFSQPDSSPQQQPSQSSPQHYFRTFAQTHRVLPTVLNILRTTKRNDLVCSAIRFFRICIGSRDSFYTSIIIDENLFEPIFIHFQANGPRYNLLNSVVCETMHFLNETHRAGDKQPPKLFNPNSIKFLEHIYKRHWTKFEFDRIQYVNTFQESKQIYLEWSQQNNGKTASPTIKSISGNPLNDSYSSTPGRSPFAHLDYDQLDSPYQPILGSVSAASNRLVTKRRKSPHRPETEQKSSTTSATPTAVAPPDGHSILSAGYFEDDEDEEAIKTTVRTSPTSTQIPKETGHAQASPVRPATMANDDDSISHPPPRLLTSSPTQSNQPHNLVDDEVGDDVDDDGSVDDTTPTRRIVFVSETQTGEITRHPLPPIPRKAKSAKRKLEDQTNESKGSILATSINHQDDEIGTMDVPAASTNESGHLLPNGSLLSPPSSTHSNSYFSPSSHGSPSKQHNPYLSLPSSELPPTAQRSPELKPMPVPAISSASSQPTSPPRQLTPIDLAEDADVANAALNNSPSHSMGHGLALSPSTKSSSNAFSFGLSSTLLHHLTTHHTTVVGSPQPIKKTQSAPSTIQANNSPPNSSTRSSVNGVVSTVLDSPNSSASTPLVVGSGDGATHRLDDSLTPEQPTKRRRLEPTTN